MLDTLKLKKDFPIFNKNPELIYLDSTATALKPKQVIDAVSDYYTNYSANVFRGMYEIAEKATQQYEHARNVVKQFINAPEKEEIIFVRSTTEGINLVTYACAQKIIQAKSEIVVSIAEHHSNFVPWQQLAFENGATFKVVGINEEGHMALNEEEVEKVITKHTAFVALYYVSNVLGTINPLSKIISAIKRVNPRTLVLVDAAQAVPSFDVDVQEIGCDFLVFSGHKTVGPTGVGVLWGKRALLEDMYPFQYGGDMISSVRINATEFQGIPHKFEAGTPHIAGVIGLAAALEYLNTIDKGELLQHERRLWHLAYEGMKEYPSFHVIGPQYTTNRTGVFAFYHDTIHAHDVAQLLSDKNIAIRSGHHCAMPLHESLNIIASARASFYLYNNEHDVEQFLNALGVAEKLLK